MLSHLVLHPILECNIQRKAKGNSPARFKAAAPLFLQYHFPLFLGNHVDIVFMLVRHTGIIHPEVYKCQVAELFKVPIAPCPGLGVISRPSKLAIVSVVIGVPRPDVEDAIHHQHPARLLTECAHTGILRVRTDVFPGEIGRSTDNSGKTEPQFVRNYGVKSVSISIGGIEVVVVCRPPFSLWPCAQCCQQAPNLRL